MIESIAPQVNINKTSNTKKSFVHQVSLERMPNSDSFCISQDIKNSIAKNKVKKVLDNEVFEFKKYNGDTFKGTIRDYFSDCIIRESDVRDDMSMFHSTQLKETAKKIIDGGLDWRKTSRMKCGPGTYFSMSSASGEEYGSGNVVIKGQYAGIKKKFPVFETCFYDGITNNIKISEVVKQHVSNEDSNKLIKEYCHDVLCNDMGIDFLYAATGRASACYVVLKDDCMNLSKFGW